MKERIIKCTAQLFLGVLNPFLIPTIGILLIMGFIPGVEYFSLKLKLILLGVIFLSTCFIPFAFIALGNLNRGLNKDSKKYFDRVMPYIFIIMGSFLGSQFLGKLPIPGIFRILLLGICFTMILSTVIAFKWKFSDYLLALGGLWGTLLALNFKFGMNLSWTIVGVILVSGFVGSSRIFLEKDSPNQVYGGFLTGLLSMFFIIALI